MPTFLELYGDLLDRELASEDRTERFTIARRKAAINEGQRRFNEDVGCFVRRAPISLSDGVGEYDLEDAGVIAAQDYIRPSKTSASLKRVGASSTSYSEGYEFPYCHEEALNATRGGWRADWPGMPRGWTLRADGGALYLVVTPAPDIPVTETWSVLWPYVARPADMVDEGAVPWAVSGDARSTLEPYHWAILAYAAGQLEKLRKDWDAVGRQMGVYANFIAKYHAQQQTPRGSTMRLHKDYRSSLWPSRPADPYR